MNIKIVLFVIYYISLSYQLIMPYNLCKNYKRITYDELLRNKNNVDKIVYSKFNDNVYFRLKNYTEFNYYNNKKTDILGILHIYQLFANN